MPEIEPQKYVGTPAHRSYVDLVFAAILLVLIVPMLTLSFRATLAVLSAKYEESDTHRSKAPWLVRATDHGKTIR